MLTNALKHGRGGGPVSVSRLWSADGLLLEVSNPRGDELQGPSSGLDGMLRRVVAVGGGLRVLSDDEMFLVRAWLPVAGRDDGRDDGHERLDGVGGA
jgi:signal transduction histidine kinase